MSGHFYAYASKASAKKSRPEWFGVNQITGEDDLLSPRVLYSTSGVWLSLPVVDLVDSGDPDSGYVTVALGVRSADYVILSPNQDGAPAKEITPEGEGGFA